MSSLRLPCLKFWKSGVIPDITGKGLVPKPYTPTLKVPSSPPLHSLPPAFTDVSAYKGSLHAAGPG